MLRNKLTTSRDAVRVCLVFGFPRNQRLINGRFVAQQHRVAAFECRVQGAKRRRFDLSLQLSRESRLAFAMVIAIATLDTVTRLKHSTPATLKWKSDSGSNTALQLNRITAASRLIRAGQILYVHIYGGFIMEMARRDGA